MLGQIVERVSGKRYAEFLKENIFDPLGLRDTLVLTRSAQEFYEAPGKPAVDSSYR